MTEASRWFLGVYCQARRMMNLTRKTGDAKNCGSCAKIMIGCKKRWLGSSGSWPQQEMVVVWFEICCEAFPTNRAA